MVGAVGIDVAVVVTIDHRMIEFGADFFGRRTLYVGAHGFFLVLIMCNHSLLRNVGEYASGARLAISTKPTDLILKATLVHGGNARW